MWSASIFWAITRRNKFKGRKDFPSFATRGNIKFFTGFGMRSKSRECAFKIIFASLFHDGDSDSFRRGVYKAFALDEEEQAYAEVLVKCVFSHKEELLSELDKLSIGFSEKRMFPVDKSLLLMAMAEIRYIDDVPDIVAIDEAVGLAKKYSTEKSVGYVNGVLATFIGKGEEQ